LKTLEDEPNTIIAMIVRRHSTIINAYNPTVQPVSDNFEGLPIQASYFAAG